MGLRVVERPVVWHANKKSLPMTGFEPRSSGVGSDRSTNWATITTPKLLPGLDVKRRVVCDTSRRQST